MGALEVMKVAKSVLHFVIVLHLFLGLVNGAKNYSYIYNPVEVGSLQKVWEAWNTSTQDLTSNLAGWSSEQTRYCEYLDPNSNATEVPTWRGVQCTFYCNETLEIDPNCTVRNVYVVGITIANASIAGTLPLEIQNISNLYTLELTGNPDLTGPLPGTLQNLWLNILDVHDNGFTGEIPALEWLWNLLLLDLSGNRFSGGYPFKQLWWMTYLQELSIGGNLLTGQIPYDAYINKTQLEKLDISDNQFNGSLPNLNPMQKLRHLDVSGNKFEGELPDLRGFEALRYVNLGRNRFNGTANLTNFLDLTGSSIALVNLSQNQLTGDLPLWDASSLGSIQELYLDNNNLSGTLNISNLAHLKLLRLHSEADITTTKLGILSLSNNHIRNVIFDANDIEKISAVILLHGNPYCENYDANDDGQRCYCSQICFVSPAKASSRRIITIAAVTSVLAVILILLVVVGILLLKSRRYKRYLQLQFEQKFEEFDVKPTIFSYNELRIATRDFSEDMKLGQGGYGAVYKGVLPNGNVVAVKQLYVKAAQGMDEFLNEVVLITGMKHRNLVNLKGCCLREKQRLLVYEYVDNYDVDHVLFQGSNREELNWSIRLKICLGIARGLHYLHALAHPRVIHRDIKAGNVLLDSNMEPKIADFGLALLFPDEQSHIMTVHVAGTKGYLAPEYASLGQLSDKVDVFSFGVLCLEIISGRKNIDETAPLDQIYLSKWAWFLHEQDRLMELIDPKLQLVTDDEVRDVQRVINLCLLCIQNSAEKRPTMARIVSILQSDTESEVIVLGEGKLSSRRSLNSTRSNRSVDYVKTGLGSVSEEGGSSSCDHGTANGSSHARGRRGSSVGGADSFAVELSEITAR